DDPEGGVVEPGADLESSLAVGWEPELERRPLTRDCDNGRITPTVACAPVLVRHPHLRAVLVKPHAQGRCGRERGLLGLCEFLEIRRLPDERDRPADVAE